MREATKIGKDKITDQIAVTEISTDKIEVGLDMNHDKNRIIGERSFSKIMVIIELEVQAIVDPGQDPELVQIGIEYVVISVGNTITLQETVLLLERKGKLSNFKDCSIWEMNKQ